MVKTHELKPNVAADDPNENNVSNEALWNMARDFTGDWNVWNDWNGIVAVVSVFVIRVRPRRKTL
jgi:hypothetical protein